MTSVLVNARFRSRPVTGVERFAMEVTSRLRKDPRFGIDEFAPGNGASGLKGHAWEQFLLPRKLDRDAILFSPCNTGPLSVKRQLVVIHDAAVWDCPDGFNSPFRLLYQQLLPRLAKRAATVATVSEFSRKQLAVRLGMPEDNIPVLGNAVSSAFSPREAPLEKGDGPRLLCVGSMDPRKNLHRLVKVWLTLRASRRLPEKATLNLVGGTNPRNFAAFEQTGDSSIHWLGRVNEETLIQHYREADAFIYPSYYEGFGLPPLEAMACGSPVLLSNAASLPEVGGPAFAPSDPASTGAAIYFDPLSEEEMGEAILKFLGLDTAQKARIRENARKRSERFSWDEVATRVGGELQRIP